MVLQPPCVHLLVKPRYKFVFRVRHYQHRSGMLVRLHLLSLCTSPSLCASKHEVYPSADDFYSAVCFNLRCV